MGLAANIGVRSDVRHAPAIDADCILNLLVTRKFSTNQAVVPYRSSEAAFST